MNAPHNKLIEEKVEAIMQEMYAVDEPTMTDEQVDRIARSILTKALTEVAAHQQARNIEAVEALWQELHDPWEHEEKHRDVSDCDKCNTKSWNAAIEAILVTLRSQHLSE